MWSMGSRSSASPCSRSGRSLASSVARQLLRQGDEHAAYRRVRHDIGQSILLGLEILIIADIVLTITIDPTLESALALALVVLVRTFLSFSLEIELDGVVPWHKGRQTERSDAAPAAMSPADVVPPTRVTNPFAVVRARSADLSTSRARTRLMRSVDGKGSGGRDRFELAIPNEHGRPPRRGSDRGSATPARIRRQLRSTSDCSTPSSRRRSSAEVS